MVTNSTRPNRQIQAILLDAAGTLMEPAEPVGQTYARIAGRFGRAADPDRLLRAFGAVFRSMPPMTFPAMAAEELKARERGWWKTLVRKTMVDVDAMPEAFDAYFDTLYAHYADPTAWRLYPEIVTCLGQLRERGLALAVASNFDSRLPGILKGLGIADLTGPVIYSTSAGVAKPEPGIFHQALGALGVDPARALHVGDGLEPDYHGARKAGLSALLLVRQGEQAAIPKDHQLTDLTGVVAWVDSEPRPS